MNRFLLKLIIFIPLAFGAQIVLANQLPADIPATIVDLESYLDQQTDLIYLGDSTVWYPQGSVTTAELLQAGLPNRTVGEVSHAAYQLDLYAYFAEYIARHPHRPETVIIPINLRSFSPEWDLRPGYQFEKEKAILQHGLFMAETFLRPYLVFADFDSPISQADFLSAPVYKGETPVGQVQDYEALLGATAESAPAADTTNAYAATIPDETQLADALVYYYMYPLSENHRKLAAMSRIVDLLRQNNIEPLFYITPLNYQQGQRYHGETFVEQVRANTDVIKNRLAEKNIDVLDLSLSLDAYLFSDTEHLHEAGKQAVATELLKQLEQLLQQQPADETDSTDPTPTPTPTPVPPTILEQILNAIMGQSLIPQTAIATDTPTPTFTPTATPTRTPTSTPTPTNRLELHPLLGQIQGTQFLGTTYPSEISQRSATFYPSANLISATYTVDVYRVQYRSSAGTGQFITLQTDLFIPRVPAETELPIFAYDTGTTGMTRGCAPSDERPRGRNWGFYELHMLSYAAQGYIGVLPDGHGFDGSGGPSDYFISALEGPVLLDAIRAAYRFLENPPDEVTAEPMLAAFIGGYSNGGQGAFAAKDMADTYAPEIPLKGIIGHGPTTTVETLLRENPVFSPYIVYAYEKFYGSEIISPEMVFQPIWVESFYQDVESKCIDEVFVHYPYTAEIYRPEFQETLYDGTLAQTYPAFKSVLDLNASGLGTNTDVPALILQGTADFVVTKPSQEAFIRQTCELGNQVTYNVYPGIPHVETRQNSFVDTLAWMDNIADGNTPPDDCATVAELGE